jgi:hypothetical protein
MTVPLVRDTHPVMPRLLYLGDVPIEASYHGSLLLFRLLEDYPSEKLTVVETGNASQFARRLPAVNYVSVPLGSRWLNTRFHSMVMAWLTFRSARPNARLIDLLSKTKFDSILTVVHGLGWLSAAALARNANVPLHLIIHDDWPRAANVPGRFRAWLDRNFASVYQQAASRMTVSPFMRQHYFERYDCDADVLYPSRALSCPEFGVPPLRLSRNDHPLTIAFAGTINSDGYFRTLIALRDSLATVNGRLLIFGPLDRESARQNGLDDPRVELCGLLRSEDLITRLRDEVDALFVPMSFDKVDKPNMEMAFPSKLADYTGIGLPLLIYGPAYCSAVRWANDNPGVAEVVQSEDRSLLTLAIQRLADASTRVALGARALQTGRRYFEQGVAQRIFLNALAPANSDRATTVK